MKKSLLYILAAAQILALWGCQQKPKTKADPAKGYQFGQIAGPSVDKEIAFYRKKTERNPRGFLDKISLAGAYLSKAQFSGDTSFFVLAEKTAQDSLKLQKDGNTGALMILASVNEARHEFGKSYELAKSVHDTGKSDLDSQSIMTSSLVELGRLEEATKLAEETFKAFPCSASLMPLARCKIAVGKDEEARKLLFRALKLEQPGERKLSARLRSLLGEMELRHGHPGEAGQYFEAALQAQNSHAPALLGLARKDERAGNLEAATQSLTQAFSYSQNPALLSEVAHLKSRAGDKAGAEELRAKAEAMLRPEIAQGSFGHARDLARILLDRGDEASLKEAVKILEEEQKQRKDAKLFEILGEAYTATGQFDEARQALEKAIATGIQEPTLWGRMAKMEERQGHSDKAQEYLGKARAIDATFQLSWLER